MPERGASRNCWSPAQIADGAAVGLTRVDRLAHVFGLVPDGVATVQVRLADGRRLTASVRDNFFDVTEPQSAVSRVLSVGWRPRSPGGRRR